MSVLFSILAVLAMEIPEVQVCPPAWSFGGMCVGEKPPVHAEQGTPARQLTFSVDGFNSTVKGLACIDASEGISLIQLTFMGEPDQLLADLRALGSRWSDARRLFLGVADEFVRSEESRYVSAYYDEVVYDQRGWQALIQYKQTGRDMVSLHVGVRRGHPTFIRESPAEDGGINFAIDHDLFEQQVSVYRECGAR